MTSTPNPSRQAPAPLLTQVARFANTCAGLDLTLRLSQAISIIMVETCTEAAYVEAFSMANMQLDLARRYLRFFGFFECFQKTSELLTDGSSKGRLSTILQLIEATGVGMYLVLEDLTMLHDMHIWMVPWYNSILVEANKFWFFAICASITRTVLEHSENKKAQVEADNKASETEDEKKTSETGAEETKCPQEIDPLRASTSTTLRSLLIDSCDLTLPATAIGWLNIGDLRLGIVLTVSSLLVWPKVWAAAQH